MADELDPDLDIDPDIDIDAEPDEYEEPDPDLEPDEPEPDEGDDEPEPDPPRQARKPFSQRVEEVAERKIAERTRRYEEELAALKATITAPVRESQQQINERLAQMEPWERSEYLRQQESAEFRQTLQRIEFQSQDSADRTSFEALATRVPIAAKLKDEVESRLADMRKSNMTAPRETVLKYLIGERALANAGRAKGKAQREADANRVRQTARPTAARGDTARDTTSGQGAAGRAKRLEGVNI